VFSGKVPTVRTEGPRDLRLPIKFRKNSLLPTKTSRQKKKIRSRTEEKKISALRASEKEKKEHLVTPAVWKKSMQERKKNGVRDVTGSIGEQNLEAAANYLEEGNARTIRRESSLDQGKKKDVKWESLQTVKQASRLVKVKDRKGNDVSRYLGLKNRRPSSDRREGKQKSSDHTSFGTVLS